MNCVGCPVQTYKPVAGNDNCTACPDNSSTDAAASLSCRCSDGLNGYVVDGYLVRCLGKSISVSVSRILPQRVKQVSKNIETATKSFNVNESWALGLSVVEGRFEAMSRPD